MASRQPVSAPPSESSIQVVEESAERLVVLIPPGGKQSRFIGCFAMFWLLVTAIVSGVFCFAMVGDGMQWKGGKAPPVWFLPLFLSAFWAVGIGMTIAWVRLRFTRLLLVLEPSRLAIKRELFNSTKVAVLELEESSQAVLESAYEENDRPVYRVCVTGVGREEKFGTGLAQPEKEWLVRTINGFLKSDAAADESPAIDSAADAPQPASSFGETTYRVSSRPPELAPADLPSDSPLSVDDSDPDRLKVSFVAVSSPVVKLGVGAFCGVFSLMWFGGLGAAAWGSLTKLQAGELQGMGLLFVIVPLVMCFLGLGPLLICLAVWKGRVTISIDRDQFVPRLHVGPIGKSFPIATDSILDVGIGTGQKSPTDVPIRGRRMGTIGGGAACVVLSTERSMPVSFSSEAQFNEQLAGLIRYQLRQVGHELRLDERG